MLSTSDGKPLKNDIMEKICRTVSEMLSPIKAVNHSLNLEDSVIKTTAGMGADR